MFGFHVRGSKSASIPTRQFRVGALEFTLTESGRFVLYQTSELDFIRRHARRLPFPGTYANLSRALLSSSCFTGSSFTKTLPSWPALPPPQAFYVSVELTAT